MDHNHVETWHQSGLDNEAAVAALSRETDRDVLRQGLLTDELRRQVEAIEANQRAIQEALEGLFPTEPEQEPVRELDRIEADATTFGASVADEPRRQAEAVEANQRAIRQALEAIVPTEPEPIARPSQQQRFEAIAPAVGISPADDSSRTRELEAPARDVRSDSASVAKRFSREVSTRELATRIDQKPPEAGRSRPTDAVLGQFGQPLPLDSPASWYNGSRDGVEHATDGIDQHRPSQPGPEFRRTWDAVPGAVEPAVPTSERRAVNRAFVPRMVQRDPATELTMAKALTRDRTLGESAVGSAFASSPEIHPIGSSRGTEPRVSPSADPPARSSANDSMQAAAEALERLRSAARRAADELEKVRGPVPPALPARPPAFPDRS